MGVHVNESRANHQTIRGNDTQVVILRFAGDSRADGRDQSFRDQHIGGGIEPAGRVNYPAPGNEERHGEIVGRHYSVDGSCRRPGQLV